MSDSHEKCLRILHGSAGGTQLQGTAEPVFSDSVVEQNNELNVAELLLEIQNLSKKPLEIP